MKTDLVDVSETRKDLRVEIPSDVVDAQIARITLDYSRRARIPGFRPGKAPARVIKQRFKSEILHDVLARSCPARRRRCAAGTGRGGGQHAGHSRRHRR